MAAASSSGPPGLRPSASSVNERIVSTWAPRTRCSVTAMPAAGQPFIVSSTWVLRCPIGFLSGLRSAAKCIHLSIQIKCSRTRPMPRTSPNLKVIQSAPATRRGARQADAVPAGATQRIVASITTAIVERRLVPGTKLAEQKIADIFKVSRTIVRQALNRLSRDKLVTLEPARGARVAEPSIEEARQVFEVRQMLESALARRLAATITPAQVARLRAHLADEQASVKRVDVSGRTRLLADFHVVLARMLGNDTLADLLAVLWSRCS